MSKVKAQLNVKAYVKYNFPLIYTGLIAVLVVLGMVGGYLLGQGLSDFFSVSFNLSTVLTPLVGVAALLQALVAYPKAAELIQKV